MLTRVQLQQAVSACLGPNALIMLGVAAAYFLALEVGIWFMLDDPALTLVVPASGVGLALVYRLGYRVAVAILAAALLFQFHMGTALLDGLLMAVGQTVAPLIGVWMLRKYTGFSPRLGRMRDVLALLVVGGMLASGISSIAGALALAGIGQGQVIGFTQFWWVCWVADLMGILIVAPLILAWRPPKLKDWPAVRTMELLLLLLFMALAGGMVYGDRLMSELTRPLSYAVFPLVIWAATRFSVRELSLVLMMAAGIAVYFTAMGTGPFIMGSDQANLLSMQGHIGLLAVSGLILSAAMTELCTTLEALAASESKYRLLVENQGEVVLKLDSQARVLFASPSFHRMFNSTDADVIGWPLRLPVHDADPHIDQDLFAALSEPPHAAYLEHRLVIGKDERWLAWACKAIRDDHDQVGSFVCVGRDVTERRDAEDRARRHLQELGRVGRISAMGEMAGGLAHELNQPLCAIMSFSQAGQRLLDRPESSAQLRSALDRVVANADRAANIIRHMRAFVGNEEPVLESSDINALIREVHGLTAGDASRHQVRIVLDLTRMLPRLQVSPIQIQQVLVNLIRNAVEAVDGGGPGDGDRQVRVQSRMAADGRGVELHVLDTGPGISESMRQTLFEPFVTRRTGGLGLGLSISSSIIEAHGGKLVLEDQGEAGVSGAHFRVYLPVSEAGVHANAV